MSDRASQDKNEQAKMNGLATLLVLGDEVKKNKTLREFGFFVTNETNRLIRYDTAILWRRKQYGGTELLAMSGSVEVDVHAVANQWLASAIKNIADDQDHAAIKVHDLTQLHYKTTIEFDWKTIYSRYLLWCPFVDDHNELTGGLVLLREDPFSEAEVKMITWLVASYQYTWQLFVKAPKVNIFAILKKKPVIIFLLAMLFFPIRLSVLGDATVISRNPVLINAPIDGVIREFAVKSGEEVKSGQLLFRLDKSDLESDVELSKKQLLLTEAKLRTAIDKGRDDEEISAEIPILRAQVSIDTARVEFAKKQLEKTEIQSPVAGIVVFGSKDDWINQPVRTGERIMVVTNPEDVQLKIMVPIANIIDLRKDIPGRFFPYGSLGGIPISLKTLGYNAKLMPNKILAYEMTASFVNNHDIPRLGTQGTAKLYGSRVPLVYYLFKRPLQAIRQRFGI